MYSSASQMSMLSRNMQPVGALGSADAGPPLLPFGQHFHDVDNPLSPVMAIARDHRANTENTRGSPAPYLLASSLPALSRSFSPGSETSVTGSGHIAIAIGSTTRPTTRTSNSTSSSPLTPHSSVPADTYLDTSMGTSLPMTPSWSNDQDHAQVVPKVQTHSSIQPVSITIPPAVPASTAISPSSITPHHPSALVDLIRSAFPQHSTEILGSGGCHALEIVTPPSHVLHGFLTDTSSVRTAFIHLPPPHSSSSRPEHLGANFSEVLRPHDPLRSAPSRRSSLAEGLDIRESLTALLDLSADSLEAAQMVLILDKCERNDDEMRELVHNLMYAGGQVVKPQGLEQGWVWDPKRWVLVGMEL